jgi:predicted aspartyl protease
LVVPRDLAARLGLGVLRTERVQVAGGAKEDWPLSHVWVQIEGREAPTLCFIAPAGPALLGAVALESLFLAVDPVARRLIPAEGFIGATP